MRYQQIKPLLDEQILDEVNMSPSALMKFARSPEAEGMLMGIEFELCVPNAESDGDNDMEYDYDMDERAYDINDIVRFFREGEFSQLSNRGAEQLRDRMENDFFEWQSQEISNNIDEDELRERIHSEIESNFDVDDYMEAAAEELDIDPASNDQNEDKVRLRAQELLNDAVGVIMNQGHDNRDYNSVYERAMEDMEEDMRGGGDYDQAAWLGIIGIDYMSDAENKYSLDWPHMTSGDGGDVSVEDVADDFRRAMGIDRVNTATNYHGARRDGVNWIIEPDSSIDADEGDGGLEFVSPPMPLAQGLEMIQRFKAWASEYGCYTNNSTGLHMNISVPDMTVEKLDYVKLALFLGDEYVLKQFDREYNSYAKSAMSKIRNRIKPQDVPAVLNQMKQHLNSLASKTIHSGITDKYTSINTKSNYVEFRGPGGDYLDKDPMELINTAVRLAMSLRIATDPESYKQEYAKKLYKLVEQDKNPDESVRLFSQYAVGQLPKEDLVARIKFARRDRELEKGKKAPITRLINDEDVKRKVAGMPNKWSSMLLNMGDYNDQHIQSTINNLESGEHDSELDADEEVPLAIAILKNELESRAAGNETKSFWVMNKDGSGGRQLVLADNENAAIIKGGKQMGMNRETSIVKLRAEEKTVPLDLDTMSAEEYHKQTFDLPTRDIQNLVLEIQTRERGTLETALRSTKTLSGPNNRLTDTNREFLQAVIERELARRDGMDQGQVDSNQTRWKVTIEWNQRGPAEGYEPVYVDADSPRQAKIKAAPIFDRQMNLGDGTVNPNDLEAIATTQDAGRSSNTNTDNNELTVDSSTDNTWLAGLDVAQRGFLQAINSLSDMTLIDRLRNREADRFMTDQQAAYFRIQIQRELRRRGINADDEATPAAAQQDAGRETTTGMTTASREVFDRLPQGWQDTLTRVSEIPGETLQSYVDHILIQPDHVLSTEQKDFMIRVLNTEMRRRSNNNELAANAGRAENEVRVSLPYAHREFLDQLADKSDIGLINILRNNNAYVGVTEQAAAYFRIQIRRELRRRGINPDSEEANSDDEIYDSLNPSMKDYLDNVAEHHSTDLQSKINDVLTRNSLHSEQKDYIVKIINQELRRRSGEGNPTQATSQDAAAAQQSELVNRDDPVSSNDVEAQSQDFEIRNPHTNSVVSMVRNGNLEYAQQRAQQYEQDLGLEPGTLKVSPVTQTNESLNTLRRLAGLAL